MHDMDLRLPLFTGHRHFTFNPELQPEVTTQRDRVSELGPLHEDRISPYLRTRPAMSVPLKIRKMASDVPNRYPSGVYRGSEDSIPPAFSGSRR